MRAGLMLASTGAVVAAVAGGYGFALTESSFAGSTTSAPIVIAVIATAASPNVARGGEGA
jgi:hypothetical protein